MKNEIIDENHDDDDDDNNIIITLFIIQHTWNHICNQSLIQGHFTKEEDEIICRKVKDALNSTSTGTLPHGFWVAIGEELNRIPDSITLRWNRYLSTLQIVIMMQDEDDDAAAADVVDNMVI